MPIDIRSSREGQCACLILARGLDIDLIPGDCVEMLAFANHRSLPISFHEEESMYSSAGELRKELSEGTKAEGLPKPFHDAIEELERAR
ncbi:MAG: hypothetical protein V3U79_09490 [Dehalococcoidia bacterium]